MTNDIYCRHCPEPIAGPRESDGVCQRCGETEREADSDWVPTALGEDALEQEFGLHGVRRLPPSGGDNSLTVAQCRELLARGRELQDALRPRIDRMAGQADDAAPDWDRLRADEAEEAEACPHCGSIEQTTVCQGCIETDGDTLKSLRGRLFIAERNVGRRGAEIAELREALDHATRYLHEEDMQPEDTARLDRLLGRGAWRIERATGSSLRPLCLQCLGIRPTADERIVSVSSADPYRPCACPTRIGGGVHGRGPDKGKPAADTVFHTGGCEIETLATAARLDLSPEAVAATAEAVSASRDRAKATLEEAALKKWYAASKRDPDNEQLVRSFERAYPAARRFGSDGPDDGGQS